MKILFRTDASTEIGTGHVMRCLALADALRDAGNAVAFACREHPGNLCSFIAQKGFTVHRLPLSTTPRLSGRLPHAHWLGTSQRQDAIACFPYITAGVDWLAVDHYALDAEWETLMHPYARRLIVIDDLADRTHDCELLVDQNQFSGSAERYRDLVPAGCLMLIGPRYALLRKEFHLARMANRVRDGNVRQIAVYFGGSDRSNETVKALNAVRALDHPFLRTDVVLGANNAWQDDVRAAARQIPGVVCHAPSPHFAQTLLRADLAILAGGVTRWEGASLGVPMILLGVADNQRSGIVDLVRARAAIGFPDATRVSHHDLARLLRRLADCRLLVRKLSERCMALTDTCGAQRVAGMMACAFLPEGCQEPCP